MRAAQSAHDDAAAMPLASHSPCAKPAVDEPGIGSTLDASNPKTRSATSMPTRARAHAMWLRRSTGRRGGGCSFRSS
eukprot:5604291-Prymnesium_polylepis.1